MQRSLQGRFWEKVFTHRARDPPCGIKPSMRHQTLLIINNPALEPDSVSKRRHEFRPAWMLIISGEKLLVDSTFPTQLMMDGLARGFVRIARIWPLRVILCVATEQAGARKEHPPAVSLQLRQHQSAPDTA